MGLKNNLDQLVYEKILDDIIAGKYAMGQKILAGDIADKYGISKTPVTQAIKLLCNDDIFEILPTGRIIVPRLSRKDVEDVCSVRTMLEDYCADIICARELFYNKDLVRKLRGLAETCRINAENRDYLSFAKTDAKLHQTFVSGADNEYMQSIFQKVHGRYTVASYLMLELENRDLNHSIREHFALIESIENRDAVKAKAILKSHINYILSLIENDEAGKEAG